MNKRGKNTMRFKILMRNVNVLNVVLMAAIMLWALYILSPLLYPQAAFTLPSPKKALRALLHRPWNIP